MKSKTAVAMLAAILALDGCGSNPGTQTQAQLEADLAATLKAKSVKLTRQADGSYAGEAIGANDAKFQLKVTQDPANRSYWYEGKSEAGGAVAGGKKSY